MCVVFRHTFLFTSQLFQSQSLFRLGQVTHTHHLTAIFQENPGYRFALDPHTMDFEARS